MTSAQLKAFDVKQEPAAVRERYGDTPFGRACLAARRLTEVGVRCVEVTLDGWDTHVNNHETHRKLARRLDPALAALDPRPEGAGDARQDGGALYRGVRPDSQGQPGRRPGPLAERLQSGHRRRWDSRGQVIGATDPTGIKHPDQPTSIADVHATILKAVGARAPQGKRFAGRPAHSTESGDVDRALYPDPLPPG